MNRTALLKRAGSIWLHTPALWIVTLIGILVQAIASYALREPSIGVGILQTVLAFIVTAFTSGALISLVNSAASEERASIGAGIGSGLRNLAPLLITSLILAIPVWILLVLATGSITDVIASGLGQPNSLQISDLLNNLGGLLSIVGVVFVIAVLVHAISVGAERAIVIDGQAIVAALKKSVLLLRTKVVDFITWGLILAVAILGLEMIVAVIFGQLINVPDFDQSVLGTILITLNVIVGALTTVLISTIWTLVYREWQNPTMIKASPDEKRVSKKKG